MQGAKGRLRNPHLHSSSWADAILPGAALGQQARPMVNPSMSAASRHLLRQQGVEPGLSISPPTKQPAPRWVPSPFTLVLPSTLLQCRTGLGIPPETQGQIQRRPFLAAGTWGKAGDGNTKERRQSSEACLAHAMHRNIHEHPKATGSRRFGRAVPFPLSSSRTPAPLDGGGSLLHPMAACGAVP